MPYPHRNPDDHPRRNDQLDAVHAAWTGIRHGIPVTAHYVRSRDDAAEAEEGRRAWHAVALIQAQLRGEPGPVPIAEPWSLPPCLSCGYRMRCRCQEVT